MPTRTLLCALAFAATATAAGAIGIEGLGPWHHATSLYPVIRAPWISYDDFAVRHYHAIPHTPAQRCADAMLDPVECKAASDPLETDAGYLDSGIAIEIRRFPLSNMVALADKRHEFDGIPRDFIATQITIDRLDDKTTVDPDRIAALECGSHRSVRPHASFSAKTIRYVQPRACRATAGRTCPKPPVMDTIRVSRMIYITLMLPVDPVTTKTCVLRFSGAIHSASGKPIPDLLFRRHSASYPPPKTIP